MKFITTLLALLVCSSTLMGKAHVALMVRDHKKVKIIVEDIVPNALGITREDIILASKLSFLRNGLKVVDPKTYTSANLWIVVNAMDINVGGSNVGCATNVSLMFQFHVSGRKLIEGDTIKGGLLLVTSKEMFLNYYGNYLDQFILDYLESNPE